MPELSLEMSTAMCLPPLATHGLTKENLSVYISI
jgi:hypothetical protein